jgi:hypothetical protein
MFQILLHMQVSLGSHSKRGMATRQTSPCDSAYLDNTLSSRQALEQKAVEYLPAEIRTVTGPAYEARVSVFDTIANFPENVSNVRLYSPDLQRALPGESRRSY